MTAAPTARGALIVGGGAGARCFTLVAAVQVAGWTIGSVERTHAPGDPRPGRRLDVDAGSGDIVIVPSAGDDVRIDSSAKGRCTRPSRARPATARHVASRRLPGDQLRPVQRPVIMHVPPDAGRRRSARAT